MYLIWYIITIILKEIDNSISERIYSSCVGKVYAEWKNRGLMAETQNFFAELPTEVSTPIIHSFITHVHKEKGLFLDILGQNLNVPEGVRKPLACSAEILWALSLMMDDITDCDETRGGLQSCWAQFGKEQTLHSAYSGLKGLGQYLTKRLGDKKAARYCMGYVQLGMESLYTHRTMNLDTPTQIILRNYEQRCDFHGIFQLGIMYEHSQIDNKEVRFDRSMAGLRHYYKGGQIINDLKDFAGGDLYSRAFSDLRNNLVTVSLINMYSTLLPYEQLRLRKFLGSKYLNMEERQEIENMVSSSRIIEKSLTRAQDCYRNGMDFLSTAIGEDDLKWFDEWASYKMTSIRNKLS